jgi:hypothetical protein
MPPGMARCVTRGVAFPDSDAPMTRLLLVAAAALALGACQPSRGYYGPYPGGYPPYAEGPYDWRGAAAGQVDSWGRPRPPTRPGEPGWTLHRETPPWAPPGHPGYLVWRRNPSYMPPDP